MPEAPIRAYAPERKFPLPLSAETSTLQLDENHHLEAGVYAALIRPASPCGSWRGRVSSCFMARLLLLANVVSGYKQ
jgi:hypothetical protein